MVTTVCCTPLQQLSRTRVSPTGRNPLTEPGARISFIRKTCVHPQEHGRPEIGYHAETGAVGNAEARHEGAAGPSGADRQGHDAGTATRPGRHGDGQGSVAEPEQQGAERATVAAHQPGHSGDVEERPNGQRR